MINTIARSITSVALALIVAFALVVGVEGLSALLHPWPADFAGSPEEVLEQVATYPAWVLLILAGVGWGSTMLISTYLATRLSSNRHPAHGYGVGLFLLAMVVFNMSMLPYPNWLWVLNLLVLPAAAYFGTALGRAKPA
jgi:hypothetical protein